MVSSMRSGLFNLSFVDVYQYLRFLMYLMSGFHLHGCIRFQYDDDFHDLCACDVPDLRSCRLLPMFDNIQLTINNKNTIFNIENKISKNAMISEFSIILKTILFDKFTNFFLFQF